jgi:hypothetical protein
VTGFAVSVLPEAENDILESILWYREQSRLAADAFRSEAFDAINDLAETGRVWPGDEHGVHHRVLQRFPYTIHYEITGTDLTVIAVAHRSRYPGFWRQR